MNPTIPKRDHKARNTTQILSKSNYLAKDYIKLPIDNIVFPPWGSLGLYGKIFAQCVKSKEQPGGYRYDEATCQTVLRAIDGRLFIDGKPDCFAWGPGKLASVTSIRPIDLNTSEGIATLIDFRDKIKDPAEKEQLVELFTITSFGCRLMTTPAEERRCIEVTEELYASGVHYCVDDWRDEDEDGMADVTPLIPGDFLVVTKEQGVFRIGKEEFLLTHKLLKED